jgi:hypothetical protein
LCGVIFPGTHNERLPEDARLGLISRIQDVLTGPARSGLIQNVAEGSSLRSPDSSAGLAAIYGADTVGLDGPVSVGQALSVPAVSRAVDLYTAAISQMTLTASVESASTVWLNWTDGPLSPAHRNVQIFMDLFWYRWSCLAVARDASGHVSNGVHIPQHLWDFDAFGNIRVEGRPVNQDEVLFIPSFKQLGFLDYAQDTVRHYLSLGRTINDRADNPTPMVGIKVTDDMVADDAEVEQAMEDWGNARRAKGGATAFIPPGVDVVTPGAEKDDSAMLTDARNAARLDAANFTNLPASMLDGNSGTTDQYSNTLQNANEFLKLSVSLFTRAIEARLSQDDVTPEGVTVSFNTASFDDFTPAHGNAGTATAPGSNGAIPA